MKAGFTTFTSAVTPEAAWKPLEVVVKNAKPLWELLDHKKSMYSWKVCYVPTSGTGAPVVNPVSRSPKDLVDLTEYKNLLSVKYNKKVMLADCKAYTSWYQ